MAAKCCECRYGRCLLAPLGGSPLCPCKIPPVRQGGIPQGIWEVESLQKYLEDIPFGYVGNFQRTDERDRILVHALLNNGLSEKEVAAWLTSTSGRHLMDDVDEETSQEQFTKQAEAYAKSAPRELEEWGLHG